MPLQIKCDLQCDVKKEENAKRKGLSFIAAPNTAEVSHRTTAFSGTFCGSYCVQDVDKGTAICKEMGKKCTGGGGGDGVGGDSDSDSDGRLTRKIILYLVQEYCMCGYVSM